MKKVDNAIFMRDAVLTVIAQSAQRFLTSMDWKSHLSWLLHELGKAVAVSRVYYFEIFLGDGNKHFARQTAEWCARGITPQINNPDLQAVPLLTGWFASWAKKLAKGKPTFSIVKDLPKLQQIEFNSENILSLLVVPVHSGGEWVGFIGFDDCLSERAWSIVEVEVLQTAASLLGTAIQNQKADTALREANENLTRWNQVLELHNREANLMNDFGELMQNSISEEEMYALIRMTGNEFFPNSTGALFILNSSQNLMDARAVWGNLSESERIFESTECWGFRRGRLNRVSSIQNELVCQHIARSTDAPEADILYLCAPIVAQADVLGILHVRQKQVQTIGHIEVMTNTIAERIGVTLSNLRLREKLRIQSIRDPLTNLYNRRYLEETLDRELKRAARYSRPLGILMFDIDHFKEYNDRYGHDAGDMVLYELGIFFQSQIRAEDIACRYGGEEFILVLTESNLEDSMQRAELIREGACRIALHYREKILEPIRISGGVASFPEHGLTIPDLIRAADQALYGAKRQGRDRIMAAQT